MLRITQNLKFHIPYNDILQTKSKFSLWLSNLNQIMIKVKHNYINDVLLSYLYNYGYLYIKHIACKYNAHKNKSSLWAWGRNRFCFPQLTMERNLSDQTNLKESYDQGRL